MRLSHPIAIKSASLLASWALRAWGATLNVRHIFESPEAAPRVASMPHLYVTWHENIPLTVAVHARDAAALISQHRDGELIAQTVRMLGGQAIRGSTTRGGAAAVRELMQLASARHLAITPDGPRGPRRVAQSGVVYLASRAQMPLVPVGIAYARCWRARSWDRMAIPKPFSNVLLLFGRPIIIPSDAPREGIELHLRGFQTELDRMQARADALVRG